MVSLPPRAAVPGAVRRSGRRPPAVQPAAATDQPHATAPRPATHQESRGQLTAPPLTHTEQQRRGEWGGATLASGSQLLVLVTIYVLYAHSVVAILQLLGHFTSLILCSSFKSRPSEREREDALTLVGFMSQHYQKIFKASLSLSLCVSQHDVILSHISGSWRLERQCSETTT